MNKTALFFNILSKICLAQLSNFCQNFTLHAYSGHLSMLLT